MTAGGFSDPGPRKSGGDHPRPSRALCRSYYELTARLSEDSVSLVPKRHNALGILLMRVIADGPLYHL